MSNFKPFTVPLLKRKMKYMEPDLSPFRRLDLCGDLCLAIVVFRFFSKERSAFWSFPRWNCLVFENLVAVRWERCVMSFLQLHGRYGDGRLYLTSRVRRCERSVGKEGMVSRQSLPGVLRSGGEGGVTVTCGVSLGSAGRSESITTIPLRGRGTTPHHRLLRIYSQSWKWWRVTVNSGGWMSKSPTVYSSLFYGVRKCPSPYNHIGTTLDRKSDYGVSCLLDGEVRSYLQFIIWTRKWVTCHFFMGDLEEEGDDLITVSFDQFCLSNLF